jgi:hypothetical protein
MKKMASLVGAMVFSVLAMVFSVLLGSYLGIAQ